ncbi:MAG: cupin domain-containing protein [Nitrospirota bacterium]
MPEPISAIASRIRELRQIANMPVEKIAHELHITPDTYREYEEGAVDIPVGALFKIARTFNVDLTEILTGEAPRLHEYCLVRKGKGVCVDRRKDYRYQSLAYNFVHKKAEPLLVIVDPLPDTAPVPLNSHPGQEFTYVISGSLKLVVNSHEFILNAGDSLYFDSGFEHGMKALNGKPAEFLAVIV